MSEFSELVTGGDGNHGVLMGIAIVLMIVAFIFSIATSSIGLECYNNNSAFAETKKSNKNYLITSVVLSVLGLILSVVGGIILAVKK